MLQNRSIFYKIHENVALNEFMLFGCFKLDQFGKVVSIEKTAKGKLVSTGDVEDFEIFKRNNSKGFTLTSGGYTIPDTNAICPCCGKVLTIDDIKNNPCVYVNGKFYHDSCWRNYRRLTEVDKFTRKLMDNVYKKTDYNFELLPNGYCQ